MGGQTGMLPVCSLRLSLLPNAADLVLRMLRLVLGSYMVVQ